MGGTAAGGKKAARANIRTWGDDFYKRIGSKGGQAGRGPGYTGGFANPSYGRALARSAGAIGGSISRRDDSPKLTAEEKQQIRDKLIKQMNTKQYLEEKHSDQRDAMKALALKWQSKSVSARK